MPGVTVSLGLDQRGATARPGQADGGGHGGLHGVDILPVDDGARHGIGSATDSDVGHRRRQVDPGVLAVLVVLAHEDDGELPDGGQVEPFVKSADVGSPIAEHGNGHVVGAQHLGGKRSTSPDGDPGADNGKGRQQADRGVAQVHRTAQAPHAADLAAQDLAQYRLLGHPQGQGQAMAAIGAGHGVCGPCGRGDGHAHGFLALRRVRRARDKALTEKLQDPFFGQADLDHATVTLPPVGLDSGPAAARLAGVHVIVAHSSPSHHGLGTEPVFSRPEICSLR